MKATNKDESELSSIKDGLSARLKKLEESYANRSEAVKAYGLQKGAYEMWVYARSSPSVEALAKIAKVAGVSLDWLAFGEGGTPAEQGPDFNRTLLRIDHGRIGKIANSFNVLYEELAGQYDEEDILPELKRVVAIYNLTIDVEDDAELDRALKIAMQMHGEGLIDKAKVRREKPPETPEEQKSA